jgi:hypothetical protein
LDESYYICRISHFPSKKMPISLNIINWALSTIFRIFLIIQHFSAEPATEVR